MSGLLADVGDWRARRQTDSAASSCGDIFAGHTVPTVANVGSVLSRRPSSSTLATSLAAEGQSTVNSSHDKDRGPRPAQGEPRRAGGGETGCALAWAAMSIGKRNKKLNAAAIKLAKAIGPIHFSDGDKKCEPMNVLKHLTSDYLRNKLGI